MASRTTQSFWSFLRGQRNRTVLGWICGGVAVIASGAWTVVTYIWPHTEAAKTVCAQQGSVAVGHDAIGNSITYTNTSAAGNVGVTSCIQTPSK